MTNEDLYDVAFGPKNPNQRAFGWRGDMWIMPEEWEVLLAPEESA